MTQADGEMIESEDEKPPRTIEEMQLFAADLHARCAPREGYVSREATLYLNAREIAGLDAVTRFLALISPFRQQILDIVNGTDRQKFRRRA